MHRQLRYSLEGNHMNQGKIDATIDMATSSETFRTRGADRETDTTSKIVCISSRPSARTSGGGVPTGIGEFVPGE
jgi:hypothetical protein